MNAILLNQPDADYRAASGVCQSRLKAMRRSPAHYKAGLDEPQKETSSLTVGKILHHVVLTPDVAPWWVVKPAGHDGRTKEGKAWAAENAGKPDISQDEWTSITGMANAISEHPAASQALAVGAAEVSVFADFSLGGIVQRKGRLDFVNAGNSIVDIKTCEDASPAAFGRDAFNYRYHFQAAYYLDLWDSACNHPEACALANDLGGRKDFFVIVAVEKTAPYGVIVYSLDQEAIQAGRGEYTDCLQKVIECEETGQWPCYAQEIETLKLPAWVAKKPEPDLL